MRSLGTSADTPGKKEGGTYLPVHDLPPDRDNQLIPPDQRAKIEAELKAARDRQAVVTQNPAAK